MVFVFYIHCNINALALNATQTAILQQQQYAFVKTEEKLGNILHNLTVLNTR